MVPFASHSACTVDEFPGPKDWGDHQLSPAKEENTDRSVLQEGSCTRGTRVPSFVCLDVRQQSGCCSLIQGESGLAPAAGRVTRAGVFGKGCLPWLSYFIPARTSARSQTHPHAAANDSPSLLNHALKLPPHTLLWEETERHEQLGWSISTKSRLMTRGVCVLCKSTA